MKKNLDRIVVISLILVWIIALTIYGFNTLKRNKKNPTNKVNYEDKINGYDYQLRDSATTEYKALFKELKDLLKNDDYEEKEYALLISKLFIHDFYTLNNKITNTDIGGTDFILPSIKENFKLKATDTIYKYVENNIYGDRNQKLPIVKDVIIDSVESISYVYEKTKDDKAYKVNVSISYVEDLDYDKEKTITIIHNDNKLWIVEVGD